MFRHVVSRSTACSLWPSVSVRWSARLVVLGTTPLPASLPFVILLWDFVCVCVCVCVLFTASSLICRGAAFLHFRLSSL